MRALAYATMLILHVRTLAPKYPELHQTIGASQGNKINFSWVTMGAPIRFHMKEDPGLRHHCNHLCGTKTLLMEVISAMGPMSARTWHVGETVCCTVSTDGGPVGKQINIDSESKLTQWNKFRTLFEKCGYL